MEEELELEAAEALRAAPGKLQAALAEEEAPDEGPLLNENSNGLSHLLSEGGFSLEGNADESTGFLASSEMPESLDCFENNSESFPVPSFDAEDNAVGFQDNSNTADGELYVVAAAAVESETVLLSDGNDDEQTIVSTEEASGDVPAQLQKVEEMTMEVVTVEELPGHLQETPTKVVEEESTKKTINSEMVEDSEMKEAPEPIKEAVNREADTEVVSEDELPAVEKPSVQDAENVSDDELPGPKPAEMPADTEVVSEDELPSSKKEKEGESEGNSRKRKPAEDGAEEDQPSLGSDSTNASKKQAVAKDGESKPVPAEKRLSTDEKPKKKLPELDKYWKVVNDDPADFTGWTYLLQYVDQESDVEAAREAYDAFLSHYPYCYGYWRKYADYEKRKGSKKKCYEVLERGLKAIPLSVDLWIHYLNHIKNTKGEDQAFVRQQYDRAIEACGLEFRSDRLWESYIKWEAEHGTPLHVTEIYNRLLATPTLGYTSHFDNFQEHIMSEKVTAVISTEELVKLRAEVREGSTSTPVPDLPPGEDEPDDNIANEEEAQAIKERVIALRRKVHKLTGEQVAQRWTFEEGIKRPYFHVKPLERAQLKNWKSYLEWEKQHGSFKRTLVLHERCLIACALYEEFWLRLVKFLEEKSETDPSLVSLEREVLERACTVHHLDKPALHLHWAYFEEAQGNMTRAADILERLEKTCPNLMQVAYRRINLERRRGDFDKCIQLYESYIASAKNKAVASALVIKYARFLHFVKKDSEAAQKVLAEAVVKDPLQSRLYLQQLDIALHMPDSTYEQLSGYLEAYEKQEGADPETSAALAWRRLELAEEMGSAAAAREAYQHQRALSRHLRKRNRTKLDAPTAPETNKKKDNSSGATSGPNTAPSGPPTNNVGSNYYPPQPPPSQPYDQAAYQQPYQAPWNHYQQHPPNPYPWGQYPNYY